MNDTADLGLGRRLMYRTLLGTRHVRRRPACASIGIDPSRETIARIYVINLDRQSDRWRQMRRELTAIDDLSGRPLSEVARRFSAVDARYHTEPPNSECVQTSYSLADQLFVEPHPLLCERANTAKQRVEMTPQEVAVALSHIRLWKVIAAGDCAYTLVLEDDVYFRRHFARILDQVWAELAETSAECPAFDVLYLSYKEALTGAIRKPVSDLLFRPLRGMWQLSGYVLSRRGAQSLLDALPVRGPVDLWINRRFSRLKVLATRTPVIEQRLDCESTNMYSILPVLSQVGVLNQEKPLLAKVHSSNNPVFAFGDPGSGLTALAMALSMLGYRCCSDVTALPFAERERLFSKKRGREFDAYVNVGTLGPFECVELAKIYPRARFILTEGVSREGAGMGQTEAITSLSAKGAANGDAAAGAARCAVAELHRLSRDFLVLEADGQDKWDSLCRFLGCDYPSDRYPDCEDYAQRRPSGEHSHANRNVLPARRLKWDASPWIVSTRDWSGVRPDDDMGALSSEATDIGTRSHRWNGLDKAVWMLRDDTFPSNLALFVPENVSASRDGWLRLTLRQQHTAVREFTSGAIRSRRQYLYGRFAVEMRPAAVPGLITGLFLHRNSPRQEIDIEFLGRDTSKLLINVYYNPGVEGTRMEYGYRGTPTVIDLGFDASDAFHWYEIEWRPTIVRWLVDGRPVHERVNWNPTPIPHLPMVFNVNLWHSRSVELAGKLVRGALPAHAELRSIEVAGQVDANAAES
jgi:GR25 family glycosyltransferase involved in LPS biosynthesis